MSERRAAATDPGVAARSEPAAVPRGRPERGYLPQLDGLRAVAILLVLVHHAITPIAFGGLIGVDVFFVLSGFLITGILLREREKYDTIRLRRFYARRFLRLYPPLLVAIALVFVPGFLLAAVHWRYLVDTFLALTYTTPIAVQFVGGVSSVWRHTWSLGMEELFYLIWPMLVLLTFRLRRGRRLLLVIAIALGVAFEVACIVAGLTGSISYLLRAGGLFLGCALAIALHRRTVRVPAVLAWLGLAMIALGVVTATSDTLQGVGIALAGLGTVLVVSHFGSAGATSPLIRVFSWRPLVGLGIISYELYLWHYPLFVLLSEGTGLRFNQVAWIALPVALVLAIVTHVVLARWIDVWKKKLPY